MAGEFGSHIELVGLRGMLWELCPSWSTCRPSCLLALSSLVERSFIKLFNLVIFLHLFFKSTVQFFGKKLRTA